MVSDWRRWLAGGLGLGLGLGCGPEEPEAPDEPEAPEIVHPPTELGELCGSTAPVQLLSVGEHDYPARYNRSLLQRGDRLVFGYETWAPYSTFPRDRPEAVYTTTLYSTGLCGEDPRMIGDGIDVLYDRQAYAIDLLGCRSRSGDVLALDVEGRDGPRSLLSAVGCITYPYGDGIVGIQRNPGTIVGDLVFRPALADPEAQAEILLEGVMAPPPVGMDPEDEDEDDEQDPEQREHASRVFSASDEAVLVLTRDGELVSVDPHTGEHAVLRTGVRSFVTSADLRWVLWQEGLPESEPPELAALQLLDRESGEDEVVGAGSLGSARTGMVGDMVRIARLDGSTSLVMLPSLLQIDVGPEWIVRDRHPSGIVVMEPSGGGGRYALDPETREEWWLFDGDVRAFEYVGDEELVLHEEHGGYDFSYWRTSIRGGEPELLAAHVLAPVWLSNGKIGTVGEIRGQSLHGDLMIIDPATDETTLLDRDVYWRAFGPRTLRGHPWLYDEDVVLWSVHDYDRSGVWAARVK